MDRYEFYPNIPKYYLGLGQQILFSVKIAFRKILSGKPYLTIYVKNSFVKISKRPLKIDTKNISIVI